MIIKIDQKLNYDENQSMLLIQQSYFIFMKNMNNILRKFFFSTSNGRDVANAQKYISQNLRTRDWLSYAVSRYLPKQIREPYQTISWFSYELNRITQTTKQSSLGLGKIEFWKDVIDRVYKSQQPSLQPISICLTEACRNHPLTKIHFMRLIQAKNFEIRNKQIGTMSQMLRLAENARTSRILLSLQLLRIPINKDLQEISVQVGRSIGLCDHIKKIPFHLKNYRLYIPNQINSKHNINVRNLWDRVYGKPRQQLFDAILEVAAFSRQSLKRSAKLKEKLPKQAFRAFLEAVETQLFLQNLQKVNFNVFDKGLNNTGMSLPYRLFKTARNESFLYKM